MRSARGSKPSDNRPFGKGDCGPVVGCRPPFRLDPDPSVLADHIALQHGSLSWRRGSYRIVLNLGRNLKRMIEHRLQQVGGLDLRGDEGRFQLVAQGHQLIDLGDYAVLFGERRKWNSDSL